MELFVRLLQFSLTTCHRKNADGLMARLSKSLHTTFRWLLGNNLKLLEANPK